jgi:hypothetical protein
MSSTTHNVILTTNKNNTNLNFLSSFTTGKQNIFGNTQLSNQSIDVGGIHFTGNIDTSMKLTQKTVRIGSMVRLSKLTSKSTVFGRNDVIFSKSRK